jgi:hypothetical protein
VAKGPISLAELGPLAPLRTSRPRDPIHQVLIYFTSPERLIVEASVLDSRSRHSKRKCGFKLRWPMRGDRLPRAFQQPVTLRYVESYFVIANLRAMDGRSGSSCVRHPSSVAFWTHPGATFPPRAKENETLVADPRGLWTNDDAQSHPTRQMRCDTSRE